MFKGCQCFCPSGKGESVSDWSYTQRRSGRDRRCCECGDVIPGGAWHRCLRALIDGEWIEDRWCERCDRVRRDAMPCSLVGHLWQKIGECYGPDVAEMEA